MRKTFVLLLFLIGIAEGGPKIVAGTSTCMTRAKGSSELAFITGQRRFSLFVCRLGRQ
jgi:hypothetical protein